MIMIHVHDRTQSSQQLLLTGHSNSSLMMKTSSPKSAFSAVIKLNADFSSALQQASSKAGNAGGKRLIGYDGCPLTRELRLESLGDRTENNALDSIGWFAFKEAFE
jgi:hypothetical protein